MTEFEGDLVIGGDFSMVGGVPAQNMARWDGEEWSAVGGGHEDNIYELTVFDGKIAAAAGWNRIYLLNDGTWTEIGHVTGVSEGGCFVSIEALFPDEKLIVGGSFAWMDGMATNHITGWDGYDWGRPWKVGCKWCNEAGYGCDFAIVYDLMRYKGSLIACGCFYPGSIARWDGDGWQALHCGAEYWVYSMIEWEGNLLVGGDFSSAFCHEASNIGIWDFNVVPIPRFNARSVFDRIRLEWTTPTTAVLYEVIIRFSTDDFPQTSTEGEPVPNGNDGIFDAAPGETYEFSHTGLSEGTTYYYSAFVRTTEPRTSSPMKCIATVTGKPIGTPHKLGEDSIVDGGDTDASGLDTGQVGVVDPGHLGTSSVVPNPMTSGSRIRFELASEGHVQATVYDTQGRLVRHLLDAAVEPGERGIAWDGMSSSGDEVPAGLYFIVLETPCGQSVTKIMVIR